MLSWSANGTALLEMRKLAVEMGPDPILPGLNWGKAEKSLKGERYGELLACVMADVRTLSQQVGVQPADAAEMMRRGVCDGAVAAEEPGQLRNLLKFLLYGAREKLSAEAELGEVMRQHPAFRGFPVQEAWRLCMDEDRWHEPGGADGLRFDNEPGYMGAMLRGLTGVIQDNLKRPGRVPNAAEFEMLHDAAVSGVFSREFFKALRIDGPTTTAAIDTLTAPHVDYADATKKAADIMEDMLPEQLTHMQRGYRGTQGAQYELEPGWNLSEKGLAELQKAERGFKGWVKLRTNGAPMSSWPRNGQSKASCNGSARSRPRRSASHWPTRYLARMQRPSAVKSLTTANCVSSRRPAERWSRPISSMTATLARLAS